MTKEELMKEMTEVDKFFTLWLKQPTAKQNALIYMELRRLNEKLSEEDTVKKVGRPKKEG